jgi:hypothetical protein
MAIHSTRNYSDYAMGARAANRDIGIRNYVYSVVCNTFLSHSESVANGQLG